MRRTPTATYANPRPTDVATTDGLVYDAYEGFHRLPDAFCVAYCGWLEAHGIDMNVTWRTEHRVLDASLIRVHQYVRDSDGQIAWIPGDREPVQVPPFDVLVKTSPPNPEDYL